MFPPRLAHWILIGTLVMVPSPSRAGDALTQFAQFCGRNGRVGLPILPEVSNDELAAALLVSPRGPNIGLGGQLTTFPLTRHPELVAKVLNTKGALMERNGRSFDEYFDALEADHQLFVHYFGDLVPPARFVKLRSGAGIFEKKEWVMLQKRVGGMNLQRLVNSNDPAPQLTPRLRARLLTFIERYNRMKADGKAPEKQFFIDFENEEIWVYDTNFPRDFRKFIEKNELLENWGVAPVDVKNTDALLDVLVKKLPEMQPLAGKPHLEQAKAFSMSGEIYLKAYARLSMARQYEQAEALRWLASAVTVFSPGGEDPFIASLKTKFDLK